ncbi:MAG: homoserine O-acetyltransferase [Elusimicrobia bacterium HGW-Elusimicrobia-1]|jgi:homoserine O-acetyltransferase|nr:MAG: homoserine O-acetyltransferase [Elusimicrobia bacterium HGW-Elusimicrobia-1]
MKDERKTSSGEGLGIVETKYFAFNGLELEFGQKLSEVTIAYETYGRLNENKSNAVLIAHALTGDAHAAGCHEGDERPGWWDEMIGPGKAFDTDKYFVICSNVLGGCRGTTGPSSINSETGKPYGASFPTITIKDMVSAQLRLTEHLGIAKLLSVAGGSMGGMQTLEWLSSHPDRVRSAIPIATTAKHSPQQIAFSEVGRQAVTADPDWRGGDYYGVSFPSRGLAVARMVGHITYMSDASMAEKFGRRVKTSRPGFKFEPDFEVEGYLKYRGESFVKRFDANSYLYITKALDYFDPAGDRPLHEVFSGLAAKVLAISFKSDWLYPSYQTQAIVRALKIAGADVTYCEIESTYGHDAFLLEFKEETRLIKHFLERVRSVGELTKE